MVKNTILRLIFQPKSISARFIRMNATFLINNLPFFCLSNQIIWGRPTFRKLQCNCYRIALPFTSFRTPLSGTLFVQTIPPIGRPTPVINNGGVCGLSADPALLGQGITQKHITKVR